MNSAWLQRLFFGRPCSAAGAACVILVGLTGCGKPLGTLEGKVTFEGEPVTGGYVMLFPTDGNYRNSSSVRIVDGRYCITGIVPGERRVNLDHLELSAAADGEARRVPSVAGSFPEMITVAAGLHQFDLELRRRVTNKKDGGAE